MLAGKANVRVLITGPLNKVNPSELEYRSVVGGLLVHLLFDPVSMAFLPWSLVSNFVAVLVGGWLVLRQPVNDPLTVRFGLRALAGGATMSIISAAIGTIGLQQAGMITVDMMPAAAFR